MITFLGFSNRSSGIIRGKQISKMIPESEFIDTDFPKEPKNKIVIHVRKFNEQYARFCKLKKIKTGFEVADNPVTDYLYGRVEEDDFKRYLDKDCDFYIVNNDLMKEKMKEVTDKKVYVIPHHNCNFEKITKQRSIPKKLGYIGIPEYTLNEKLIADFCENNNLIFTNKNPQTHEELIKSFNDIDVGVVFFEKDSIKQGVYERTLKYKPNTKLTNFQSYGIPTICLPYESYKQFGESKCIFVENVEDLKGQVINLLKDENLFQKISKESIEVGEKYHISRIVDYYQQIIEDFREQ